MLTKFNLIEYAAGLLRQNNLRVTPQREYVLEIFLDNLHDHLSAEDIYNKLQHNNQMQISLATVYRTVRTLYKVGVLREIDLGQDHKHYELTYENKQPHHHIICLNCDHHNTIEFESPEINALASSIADKYNIDIKDIELRITGHCSKSCIVKCKTSKHLHENPSVN